MKQLLNPGKYVVAVSGGVDSVVLLNMLSNVNNLELIVAHFDHGIRNDSSKDRAFVKSLAKDSQLPFEHAEGRLSPETNEDTARKKRYEFLWTIYDKYKANAIVTAHHQDDVIETMMINLLRGTGRKGLSSLKDTGAIARPLLDLSKADIYEYAKEHNLQWREDSTNADQAILRNYIRHSIVPKLSPNQRKKLVEIYQNAKIFNTELDVLLGSTIGNNTELSKKLLINSSHDVSKEIVAEWLRRNELASFSSDMLDNIVVSAKTLSSGATVSVYGGNSVLVTKDKLTIVKY